MNLLSRALGKTSKPDKEGKRLPIFILGVPRSGTTLLRALLDSHPAIACGPETPWLGAHQPSSVMTLHQFLSENPLGYCHSFGMPRAIVTQAARQFVMTLMGAYARSKGKRRWAEKTPDNLMHLEFLAELFPYAAFIHLVRDALDTAISTSIVPPHRRGISDWHEKFLLLGPECKLENNLFNAVLRWNHWNRRVDEILGSHRLHRVSYERLVHEPRAVLQSLFDFLEEPFDARVLDYTRFKHDLPDWEWGSADVKRFSGISEERTGRAAKELTALERELLQPLAQYGRDDEGLFSGEAYASMASASDMLDDRFALLAKYLDSFAASFGLKPLGGTETWEYPWIWIHALQYINWRNRKVVFMGTAVSPLPWLLALLGAQVTLLAESLEHAPLYRELREKICARVELRRIEKTALLLPDESVDVLIWTSDALRNIAKSTAATEAARVLKHDGVLSLTCEYRENGVDDQGPGRALEEFEQLFWESPAFTSSGPPNWTQSETSCGLAGAVLVRA